MSSKRMDLNKMCFFVLSGVTNPLGKELAVEMCQRFKRESVVMLIDDEETCLQEVRKEIELLEKNIQVICCNSKDWLRGDYNLFRNTLSAVLGHEIDGNQKDFELAFIIHNEGQAATHLLIEPENVDSWMMHVQQHLYAPIAISQKFLKCSHLQAIPKLVVNISSSLWVQPLVYNKLLCSSKKARDMYFRSLTAEEEANNVIVMNFGPGIFDTHKPVNDCNNNAIHIKHLVRNSKILNLPRVDPLQSTLKLINILQEISFISGHDVDYYDTYNLWVALYKYYRKHLTTDSIYKKLQQNFDLRHAFIDNETELDLNLNADNEKLKNLINNLLLITSWILLLDLAEQENNDKTETVCAFHLNFFESIDTEIDPPSDLI